MTPFRRIVEDYGEAASLEELLQLNSLVDRQTFLTRTGDLLAVLKATPRDAECLDPAQLDAVSRQFEGALRTLDESFRLRQYLIKRPFAGIVAQPHPNAVVNELLAARAENLNARANHLFALDVYFVVAYIGWRPEEGWSRRLSRWATEPRRTLRDALSQRAAVATLEAGLAQARERLAQKVDSLVVQLQDFVPLTVLEAEEAFRFLRRLLNYDPAKSECGSVKYSHAIAYQLTDPTLECYRDHLRLDDAFVQMLSLKEPPDKTFAHILRGLYDISCANGKSPAEAARCDAEESAALDHRRHRAGDGDGHRVLRWERAQTASARSAAWQRSGRSRRRAYQNNLATHRIEPDPERAPVIVKLFEWYASGEYSLKALTKKAAAVGLTNRTGGTPLVKAKIHQLLQNPIYHGDFYWLGQLHQGLHKPIISRDLFARVQDVFAAANHPRHTKRQHAFAGLVTCARCGCAFTAETKKGQYVYYHCTGHRGACGNTYVREEELIRRFGDVLKGIQIPSELAGKLRTVLRDSQADKEKFVRTSMLRLQQQQMLLRSKLDRVYEDRLSDAIPEELWNAKSAELQEELRHACGRRWSGTSMRARRTRRPGSRF